MQLPLQHPRLLVQLPLQHPRLLVQLPRPHQPFLAHARDPPSRAFWCIMAAQEASEAEEMRLPAARAHRIGLIAVPHTMPRATRTSALGGQLACAE